MATEIYNNPISVICIKTNNSKKLVKGCEYLATRLSNSGSGYRYVYIKDIGSYKADFFTLTNGTSLLKINEFSVKTFDRVTPSKKNYTGEYVKCIYANSKYLKEGEIYYVEKQIKGDYTTYWNPDADYSFKIKNIKNKVSTYRFQEIPLIEQRYIKLKNINGDTIETGEMTRKFLLYNENQKINILFELLTKSLVDISKIQNITNIKDMVINMMLVKGKNYHVLEEEIVLFLNNNIIDLITTQEKKDC